MVSASEGLDVLTRLGLSTRVSGPSRVSIHLDDAWIDAEVITRQSPPTASEVFLLRHRPGSPGVTLFVTSRLTPGSIRAAEADTSLAFVGVEDDAAVIRSRILRARPLEDAPAPLPRRRPWGRFALIRSLLRTPKPRSQHALARECGLTQPAVSQALRMLEHVTRAPGGWSATEPRLLWEYFLAEYPGPGGLSTSWYGVAPAREQTARVLQELPGALISGDAAADEFAPWRLPRRSTLYATQGADLEKRGFAASEPARASLDLVVPADQTVWSTAAAWAESTGRDGLVDPVLAAWDVQRSGGPDVDEALDLLRHKTLAAW